MMEHTDTTKKVARRRRSRRSRRRQLGFGLVALAAALLTWVVAVPFPAEELSPEPVTSTMIVDREERPLRELLSDGEGRSRWLSLEEISPHAQAATIHAEDKRFYEHLGFDPIAIGRSAVYNIQRRRLVTGASTLTQQTVKRIKYADQPRTLRRKVMELIWAVRLERSLDKDAILAQYLNRVPYGNQLFGIEAAARMYFGKPASQLSLAEAALLAGLPQAPSALNPYRNLEGARARQRQILAAMLERGAIGQAEHDRAAQEPLVIRPRRGSVEAPHLTDRVMEELRGRRPAVVRTTLDLNLQRGVEGIVESWIARVERRGVSQGAVVVLDTQSGEVLAWVGSRDYWDREALGGNDGVVALRQPGSTLKPFAYGLYLESGGTAADPIADLPTQFPEGTGVYVPMNFNHRFHGPVSVRDALGSSLNVPAVAVTAEVGAQSLLSRLRRAGLETLTQDAEYYGLGLVLGDGEVRLVDLAAAYAALGRLGEWRPWRTLAAVDGAPWRAQDAPARRVFERDVAYTLLDMLSDDDARLVGFGANGPLALPYRVAAKTGTSTNFRDNWAVGVTPEYTVAVWVGNFDGSPMNRVSGVTGAAPMLRAVFQQLYPEAAGPADVPWFERPAEVGSHEVCALSGQPAGPSCPGVRVELFHQRRRGASGAPDAGGHRGEGPERCEVHQAVAIDTRNGLRARLTCPAEFVETHVFHQVPPAWEEWALEQGLELPPRGWSPLCDGGAVEALAVETRPRIVHPLPGDVFILDPEGRPEDQQLALRAHLEGVEGPLTWFVGGEPVGRAAAPFTLYWPLRRGTHRIGVGRGEVEREVEIEVR